MTALFGRRLLGIALLAATFLAGALAGAAIDRTLSGGSDHPEREEDRDRGRSYVIDRVEMAPEQKAAIDSILDRRSERMRAVWREAQPRLNAVTDSARMEIMEVLTPEQQAQYEQMLHDRRRDRRDREQDTDEGDGSG